MEFFVRLALRASEQKRSKEVLSRIEVKCQQFFYQQLNKKRTSIFQRMF